MTGKPGVLQSMGLQRFGHDLVTEHQHCMSEMIIFSLPPSVTSFLRFNSNFYSSKNSSLSSSVY